MPHIVETYEQARKNFIKNGGDIHNMPVVFDDMENVFVNFDGIDFILTEDGDIYKDNEHNCSNYYKEHLNELSDLSKTLMGIPVENQFNIELD